MRRLYLLPLLAAMLTVAAPAAGQQRSPQREAINANCPAFYLASQAPRAVSAPARADGRTICHSFYAISYSTSLRNPLWTSYRLTRAMADGGDRIGRYHGNFRREAGLAPGEQGRHADYVHPPFDRGHLTPANDAEDMAAQRDTFVITNVVPQISELNQGLWRFLESSVHRLAQIEGEVFIVTGAVYPANPRIMRNGIAIPTATFKAVFVPSRNIALGYLATNEVATRCTIMSIAELTRQTGVDPFPSLAPAVTGQRADFTLPRGAGTPVPDCAPANDP